MTITLKELGERIQIGNTEITKKQEDGNRHLTSIDRGIQKFLKNQLDARGDNLERDRESKRGKSGSSLLGGGLVGGVAAAALGVGKGVGGFGLGIIEKFLLGSLALGALKIGFKILYQSLRVAGLAALRLSDVIGANELKKLQAANIEKARMDKKDADRRIKKAQYEANALKRQEITAKNEADKARRAGNANAENANAKYIEAQRATAAKQLELDAARDLKANAELREAKAKIGKAEAIEVKKMRGVAQREALRFLQEEAYADGTLKRPTPESAKPLTGNPSATEPSVKIPLDDVHKVDASILEKAGIKRVVDKNGRITYRAANGTILSHATVKAAADEAKVLARAVSRGTVVSSTLGVAAVALTVTDGLSGAGQAVKAAREMGDEATNADVAANIGGSILGGIVGLYDLIQNGTAAGTNKIAEIAGFETRFKTDNNLANEVRTAFQDGTNFAAEYVGIGQGKEFSATLGDEAIAVSDAIEYGWEKVGDGFSSMMNYFKGTDQRAMQMQSTAQLGALYNGTPAGNSNVMLNAPVTTNQSSVQQSITNLTGEGAPSAFDLRSYAGYMAPAGW
jgi:hypothetical protein